MSDLFQATQGAALTIDVTLKDEAGTVVTDYLGDELLTTVLWPGGSRAALFSPTTTWTDAAAGTLSIAISSAQTATLAPGRYRMLTRLDDGSDTVDVYEALLEVLAAAGDDPEPKTYCSYDDMLRFGRGWLRQLATEDDEAGFAEQRGRARSWLEDVGHAHYRAGGLAVAADGRFLGPRISGARSTQLQAWFDADKLMLNDRIREACAKRALMFVCEGQVGADERGTAYARLAAMYRSQSEGLAVCMTLSLDTDDDGEPDVTIDCGTVNALYG